MAPAAALVTALRAAVASYRGMYLTVVEGDQPVSLSAFHSTEDGAITTSLRLPFAALAPGFDVGSRVVFYAASPGAFVDLAADLGHALHAPIIFDCPRQRLTKVQRATGSMVIIPVTGTSRSSSTTLTFRRPLWSRD